MMNDLEQKIKELTKTYEEVEVKNVTEWVLVLSDNNLLTVNYFFNVPSFGDIEVDTVLASVDNVLMKHIVDAVFNEIENDYPDLVDTFEILYLGSNDEPAVSYVMEDIAANITHIVDEWFSDNTSEKFRLLLGPQPKLLDDTSNVYSDGEKQ